jgi:hypothetical protein
MREEIDRSAERSPRFQRALERVDQRRTIAGGQGDLHRVLPLPIDVHPVAEGAVEAFQKIADERSRGLAGGDD